MAALRSSSIFTTFSSLSSQGHLDHADGTFHDLPAGGDDGGSLLALEHGTRYFGGVGQMAQARFLNFDSRFGEALLQFLLEGDGDLVDVGAKGRWPDRPPPPTNRRDRRWRGAARPSRSGP